MALLLLLVAEIGDIQWFPTAKRLASYTELVKEGSLSPRAQ